MNDDIVGYFPKKKIVQIENDNLILGDTEKIDKRKTWSDVIASSAIFVDGLKLKNTNSALKWYFNLYKSDVYDFRNKRTDLIL